MTRRGFLQTSALAGIACATGCVAGPRAATAARPLRIGGPLFGPALDDPKIWAKTARDQGYRAVYAPKVSLNEPERIRAFRDAAAAQDLVIAEVGRWVNLMDADPVKRKANFETVAEGLALADELGARCCVDIAGSFNPNSWYGPARENMTEVHFDRAVENARALIDAVKPKRSVFAYEMMGWMHPDSVDSYRRLIRAIDRKGFGVHVDLCNMVNSPEKYWNNAALIRETVDVLGPWIVSAHAKDLTWQVEMNVHFVECELGQGVIDYPAYIAALKRLPQDVPLMIEHMKDQAQYERCRDFLLKQA